MFIVYSGKNEVIVTILKKEHDVIREYFMEGGRDLDDYHREEINDIAVFITSGLKYS